MTTAVFSRRQGLEENGLLTALIVNGHVTAELLRNPKNNRWSCYISTEAAQSFSRRFMTSKMIGSAYDMPWRDVRKRMNDAGIASFTPDGKDYGLLHLRADVEGVLGKC
ncbi:hypothetical protein [Szabonella alba]|uniref:Uncharacterized protein n=1 Tax=Szabonella alba TaxID=2804194 RepID=A0A8K0V8Y1_9RHOB|nr:hypothetical protein [Szabonella alba]MBL4917306.1 hypothetical protein [Szabonella alba]